MISTRCVCQNYLGNFKKKSTCLGSQTTAADIDTAGKRSPWVFTLLWSPPSVKHQQLRIQNNGYNVIKNVTATQDCHKQEDKQQGRAWLPPDDHDFPWSSAGSKLSARLWAHRRRKHPTFHGMPAEYSTGGSAGGGGDGLWKSPLSTRAGIPGCHRCIGNWLSLFCLQFPAHQIACFCRCLTNSGHLIPQLPPACCVYPPHPLVTTASKDTFTSISKGH